MVAYSLDWNLIKGYDNEDKDVLMSSIRDTRFKGCTGVVLIEKGTNDRMADIYDLF